MARPSPLANAVFLLAGSGLALGAHPAPDRRPAAEAFVDELSSGAAAKAYARLDATMAGLMTAASLRSVWEQMATGNGGLVRKAGTRVERLGGFDIVLVRCEFARATVDVKVVFDAAGKVTGLWFVASADASAYSAIGAPPPAPPAPPPGVREVEVSVGADPWKLPGTLALPAGKGPFPALVLVHGSGPEDRDESVGALHPFRDLAWGLAAKGIAVLRYDKRTKVHAARMVKLDTLTVKEETIDDAVAAVTLLAARPEIDARRVAVLGHSLGGSLIPRIAAADGRPAGFVVMAGATPALEDSIIQQTAYLRAADPGMSAEAKAHLDALAAEAAKVKRLDKTSRGLVLGAPPSYWLDLRGYEPARAAASVKRPLLVLQGGRDYQVPAGELEVWKSALQGRKDVTFKLYPDLNHLFVAGAGKSVPSEYDRPGSVAAKVIDDIAAWTAALPVAK